MAKTNTGRKGSGKAGELKSVEELVAAHEAQRAAEFEEALLATLDTPVGELDEPAQEVVFQAYRKAMDAACPAVVSAFGRLAATFAHDAGSAFRVLGRTLGAIEDAESFEELRRVLTAIVKASERGGERVEVELGRHEEDGNYVLLTVDNGKIYFDQGGDSHSNRGVFRFLVGRPSFERIRSMLALLELQGLAEEEPTTADSAPSTATFVLDAAVCRRALEIVQPEELELKTVTAPPTAESSPS